MSSVPVNPDRATTRAANATEGSLFADLDRHRRRWFGCQTVGCGLLIIMLLLVGGLIAAVAATGIVTVPVVSPMVYAEPPAPTRLVSAEPIDVLAVVSTLPVSPAGTVDLTLTEGQFTTLVGADHLTSLREAQVTIEPSKLTFYGQYVGLPFGHPVAIELAIRPTTVAGNLRCTLESARLGQLAVPRELLRSADAVVCAGLARLVTQSTDVTVQAIDLASQQATLRLTSPSSAIELPTRQ